MPDKIAEDDKEELYRDYMARCVRILTENTAKGFAGAYIPTDYCDIIGNNTSQKSKTVKSGDAKRKICSKLSERGLKSIEFV